MKHKPEKHKAKTHNGMTKGKKNWFWMKPRKIHQTNAKGSCPKRKICWKNIKKERKQRKQRAPHMKKWWNRENAYILSASQFVWDMIQNPKPHKRAAEKERQLDFLLQSEYKSIIRRPFQKLSVSFTFNAITSTKNKHRFRKLPSLPKQLRKENVLCVRQRERLKGCETILPVSILLSENGIC